MDESESGAASKAGGAGKTVQTSAHSKGVGVRRRADMNIVQNVILILLDNNIDEDNQDCQNTMT